MEKGISYERCLGRALIRTMRNLVAIMCAAILVPGDMSVFASPSVTTDRLRYGGSGPHPGRTA